MHYLITGHTGFKGSWLALMLHMRGDVVSGISLDPPTKSLFNEAHLTSIFQDDIRLDIRDGVALKQEFQKIDPDVVIHLAAQPLVRESYRKPVETFDINVIGTLNVLESTRELLNLKAALIVTTDKVYRNLNHLRGYVETDELGGDDPYSASKAAADIAAQSWIKSFANVPMTLARAGNVIGGGDWAADRIIPDLVNAYSCGQLPILRYPNAIRPWQHVLDCLSGYLALIDKQLSEGFAGQWNFGPDLLDRYSVLDLVYEFSARWGVLGDIWSPVRGTQPEEANYLLLDSTKARTRLPWSDILNFTEAVKWTADWYLDCRSQDSLSVTRKQISNYYAKYEREWGK